MRSEGYGTWFVCQFVYDYSCTIGNEAALERYQQLQCNKRSKIKMAILPWVEIGQENRYNKNVLTRALKCRTLGARLQ